MSFVALPKGALVEIEAVAGMGEQRDEGAESKQ
jgi:hypothetical protein